MFSAGDFSKTTCPHSIWLKCHLFRVIFSLRRTVASGLSILGNVCVSTGCFSDKSVIELQPSVDQIKSLPNYLSDCTQQPTQLFVLFQHLVCGLESIWIQQIKHKECKDDIVLKQLIHSHPLWDVIFLRGPVCSVLLGLQENIREHYIREHLRAFALLSIN